MINNIKEAQTIGEAWRYARQHPKQGAALSQEECAAQLGISESYLSLIENGKRPNPPVSLAKRMAAVSRYTLEELLPP
ncbi:MAG TPA: helix-turn-helix transcriptional regulator [Thermoanaerobaculaceae bacterium]|nr:helix-turn-helix transcriptional regulator [Thermoanaerobaculaceae bacterium]